MTLMIYYEFTLLQSNVFFTINIGNNCVLSRLLTMDITSDVAITQLAILRQRLLESSPELTQLIGVIDVDPYLAEPDIALLWDNTAPNNAVGCMTNMIVTGYYAGRAELKYPKNTRAREFIKQLRDTAEK